MQVFLFCLLSYFSKGGDSLSNLSKTDFFIGTDPTTGVVYNETDQFIQTVALADYVIDGSHSAQFFSAQEFVDYYKLNLHTNYPSAFKFLTNNRIYQTDGTQGAFGSGNCFN